MKALKRGILAATLVACTAAPLSGCFSSTNAGAVGADRKQLLLVSSDEVLQLSSQAYRETIQEARAKGQLDRNPTQVKRLKDVANRLIPHTPIFREGANKWQWEVHAITADTINAYVMPGGKIVFYSGIIERLQLTDAEIAAIMGHEIAHALREHSREKISRQMATSGVLSIAASALGLSSGQAELVGLAGELGLNLPHSRTQEAEADKIGLELMARAGYNPNAAISLWQKMKANDRGGVPQFLSTHPSSEKRIQNMQALIPNVIPLYQANRRK